MAKLIFGKNNTELYQTIEDRIKLELNIIDKYFKYVNEGRLFQVSENAWDIVTPSNSNESQYKYNYMWLMANANKYNAFLKLCESDELKEIEKLTEKLEEMHNYELYDKYFESFFSFEQL